MKEVHFSGGFRVSPIGVSRFASRSKLTTHNIAQGWGGQLASCKGSKAFSAARFASCVLGVPRKSSFLHNGYMLLYKDVAPLLVRMATLAHLNSQRGTIHAGRVAIEQSAFVFSKIGPMAQAQWPDVPDHSQLRRLAAFLTKRTGWLGTRRTTGEPVRANDSRLASMRFGRSWRDHRRQSNQPP